MQGELTQSIRTMMHAVDMLLQLGYALAGLCVFMLITVISFLVAWQLRQDKRQQENSIGVAENRKTCGENERMIEKNIPELFGKWDALITGQVKIVAERELERIKKETKAHGEDE